MSTTRILDVMERNDLVARKSDPEDRRKFLIMLTDKSKEMRDDLFRLSKALRKQIVTGISDSEIDRFISLLDKMNKNIES